MVLIDAAIAYLESLGPAKKINYTQVAKKTIVLMLYLGKSSENTRLDAG